MPAKKSARARGKSAVTKKEGIPSATDNLIKGTSRLGASITLGRGKKSNWTPLVTYPTFLSDLVNSDEDQWKEIRVGLQRQAALDAKDGGQRLTYKPLLKKIHEEYKHLSKCDSDTTCMLQLFTAYVERLLKGRATFNKYKKRVAKFDETPGQYEIIRSEQDTWADLSRLGDMLSDINRLLPLQYVSYNSYVKAVGSYKEVVQRWCHDDPKWFLHNNELNNKLLAARGTTDVRVAVADKKRAGDEGRRKLAERLKNLLIVPEARIKYVAAQWGSYIHNKRELEPYEYGYEKKSGRQAAFSVKDYYRGAWIELMIGARSFAIHHATTADFRPYSDVRDNMSESERVLAELTVPDKQYHRYIHQIGVAKDKSRKDIRREVVKPILPVLQFDGKSIYTPKHVVDQIRILR
jgi:hypothetical protein